MKNPEVLTTLAEISPMSTKGDLLAYNGSAHIRLPVGTNGHFLSADSSQASGLAWKAVSLTGLLKADGSVSLTNDWDAGDHTIRAKIFHADVTTGTAPFTVASTTLVPNLNADMIDGVHATGFVIMTGQSGLQTLLLSSDNAAIFSTASGNDVTVQSQGAADLILDSGSGNIPLKEGGSLFSTIQLGIVGATAYTVFKNYAAAKGGFMFDGRYVAVRNDDGTNPFWIAHTSLPSNYNVGLTNDSSGAFATASNWIMSANYGTYPSLMNYTTSTNQCVHLAIGYHALDATKSGNLGLGINTWGTNAKGVLAIKTGVEPASDVADAIQIFSKDATVGDGEATLGLYLEQAVEAIGTFTPSHKIAVWLNGQEFRLQLDAV